MIATVFGVKHDWFAITTFAAYRPFSSKFSRCFSFLAASAGLLGTSGGSDPALCEKSANAC